MEGLDADLERIEQISLFPKTATDGKSAVGKRFILRQLRHLAKMKNDSL